MDDETRNRIERELAELDNPESDVRRRFEASLAKWDEILRPLQAAIRESERITKRDLQIVVY
jgi:hypothetical protein